MVHAVVTTQPRINKFNNEMLLGPRHAPIASPANYLLPIHGGAHRSSDERKRSSVLSVLALARKTMAARVAL